MKNPCMKIGCSILGLLMLSGCVVSRTGEFLLSVGVTETYADFSQIQDRVVYEKNGEYYMAVSTVFYAPDPALFGVISALSHVPTYMKQCDGESETVWMKITPELKQYLCTPSETADTDEDGEQKNVSGEVVLGEEASRIQEGAIRHPVVQTLRAPSVLSFCGGDIVAESQLVAIRKSWGGYCLVPVAVVGFIWDVPATILATVIFDGIVFPILYFSEPVPGKS